MSLSRLLFLLTLSTTALVGCDQKDSPSAGSSPNVGVNSATTKNTGGEYAVLIDRARAYVTEWNREDPLCDEIESPNLDSIQKGTVTFIATGGGKVDPPIPAIVARIAGTCIVKSVRKREPITKFWMMMAHDKAFDKFTCVKIGGEELIRGFIKANCEFVPNAGELGLIQVASSTPIAVAQPVTGTNVAQQPVPSQAPPAPVAAVASPAPVATEPATAALAPAEVTWAPSFDCLKASTGPERLICSNRDLSEADVRMSQAYRLAASKATDRQSLKNAQVEWRKSERDACSEVKCMLSAYQSRLAQLQ